MDIASRNYFDEASKITEIFGIYLEHISGKLAFVFGVHIPKETLGIS
jgi:hypothetical protein